MLSALNATADMQAAKTALLQALPQLQGSEDAVLHDVVTQVLSAALPALSQDEQTALDAAKGDMQAGIAQLGIIGSALLDKGTGLIETHTAQVRFVAGGVDVEWTPKAK
jgi:hypothetical protein